MKKEYETPRADKMEFDYSETVTASGFGDSYQEYIHFYTGCNEDATGNWFVGLVRESGCKQTQGT